MNIKHMHKPYKPVFMNEDQIKTELQSMEADDSISTKPSYVKDSTSTVKLISFFEKHSRYLKEHPKVNPEYYLANLKTVLRKRT